MSVATGSAPGLPGPPIPARNGAIMNDTITLTGFVATPPRHLVTSGGLPITSFRMATTQRRFDRAKNLWVDGDTNWFTINTYRQLAVNTAGAIRKGEPVVVTGRLRIRDWESDKGRGTNVEVEADSLGHDLLFGTTSFVRSVASSLAGGASVPDAGSAPPADEPSAPATDDNGWALPGGNSGPTPPADAEERPDSVPVPF